MTLLPVTSSAQVASFNLDFFDSAASALGLSSRGGAASGGGGRGGAEWNQDDSASSTAAAAAASNGVGDSGSTTPLANQFSFSLSGLGGSRSGSFSASFSNDPTTLFLSRKPRLGSSDSSELNFMSSIPLARSARSSRGDSFDAVLVPQVRITDDEADVAMSDPSRPKTPSQKLSQRMEEAERSHEPRPSGSAMPVVSPDVLKYLQPPVAQQEVPSPYPPPAANLPSPSAATSVAPPIASATTGSGDHVSRREHQPPPSPHRHRHTPPRRHLSGGGEPSHFDGRHRSPPRRREQPPHGGGDHRMRDDDDDYRRRRQSVSPSPHMPAHAGSESVALQLPSSSAHLDAERRSHSNSRSSRMTDSPVMRPQSVPLESAASGHHRSRSSVYDYSSQSKHRSYYRGDPGARNAPYEPDMFPDIPTDSMSYTFPAARGRGRDPRYTPPRVSSPPLTEHRSFRRDPGHSSRRPISPASSPRPGQSGGSIPSRSGGGPPLYHSRSHPQDGYSYRHNGGQYQQREGDRSLPRTDDRHGHHYRHRQQQQSIRDSRGVGSSSEHRRHAHHDYHDRRPTVGGSGGDHYYRSRPRSMSRPPPSRTTSVEDLQIMVDDDLGHAPPTIDVDLSPRGSELLQRNPFMDHTAPAPPLPEAKRAHEASAFDGLINEITPDDDDETDAAATADASQSVHRVSAHPPLDKKAGGKYGAPPQLDVRSSSMTQENAGVSSSNGGIGADPGGPSTFPRYHHRRSATFTSSGVGVGESSAAYASRNRMAAASTRDVSMKDDGRYSQPRSVSGDSDRKAFSDSMDTEMDGGGGDGSSRVNRYRSASRSNHPPTVFTFDTYEGAPGGRSSKSRAMTSRSSDSHHSATSSRSPGPAGFLRVPQAHYASPAAVTTDGQRRSLSPPLPHSAAAASLAIDHAVAAVAAVADRGDSRMRGDSHGRVGGGDMVHGQQRSRDGSVYSNADSDSSGPVSNAMEYDAQRATAGGGGVQHPAAGMRRPSHNGSGSGIMPHHRPHPRLAARSLSLSGSRSGDSRSPSAFSRCSSSSSSTAMYNRPSRDMGRRASASAQGNVPGSQMRGSLRSGMLGFGAPKAAHREPHLNARCSSPQSYTHSSSHSSAGSLGPLVGSTRAPSTTLHDEVYDLDSTRHRSAARKRKQRPGSNSTRPPFTMALPQVNDTLRSRTLHARSQSLSDTSTLGLFAASSQGVPDPLNAVEPTSRPTSPAHLDSPPTRRSTTLRRKSTGSGLPHTGSGALTPSHDTPKSQKPAPQKKAPGPSATTVDTHGNIVSVKPRPKKKKRLRIRSADRSDLNFAHMFAYNQGQLSMIRVWENERGMLFYDCVCNSRKPVQDLNKIKRHVERHPLNTVAASLAAASPPNPPPPGDIGGGGATSASMSSMGGGAAGLQPLTSTFSSSPSPLPYGSLPTQPGLHFSSPYSQMPGSLGTSPSSNFDSLHGISGTSSLTAVGRGGSPVPAPLELLHDKAAVPAASSANAASSSAAGRRSSQLSPLPLPVS